jgi:hypothetical protein
MKVRNGCGVAVVLCLNASCGELPSDYQGVDGRVGSIESAINETSHDRPVAAATSRTVNGVEQTWLFACDSNNVMKVRVADAGTNVWGSWSTINSSAAFKCAGPPSVGRILESPRDILGVYWRSTNNKLIEAWYRANGTFAVTDVSAEAGFGSISSNPAVAGIDNANNYISVAVREAATDEMYTIDWYQNDYVTRPMLLSGGAVFSQSVTTTVVASYATYTRDYISTQANAGAHFIFARASWADSFTQFAWTASAPASAPLGVVSLGGAAINGSCDTHGCALFRNPTNNNTMWATLQNGGNITNQFQSFNSVALGGSLAQPNHGKASPKAFARASNGELAVVNLWWSTKRARQDRFRAHDLRAPMGANLLRLQRPWHQ